MTKHTQPRALRSSAISLAIAGMLMVGSLHAGVIEDTNSRADKPGACGADGGTEACVGAWDLNNVQVSLLRALDGTVFGEFLKTTGFYTAMAAGDSFVSAVTDAAGDVVAKVTGKVWPVGEPTGIKAVNGDMKVKEGKPQNCLINTAYLSAADAADNVSGYLDMPAPLPVICSSPFQTHKRFKIAMQNTTVNDVENGAEGKPIDLVFNVKDEQSTALRSYQVFSKINNYTGKRLKGYKIVVGTGTGDAFTPASVAVPDGRPAINDKLHISLGVGEGWSSGQNAAPDGSDLFDGDGLATFSHGLFGPIELPHFEENGFFDIRTAGFNVTQNCTAPCDSDTIMSTTALPSNYTTLFGDWLPMVWQPKGIFFDTDGDPTTDAKLMAYWDGSAWRKNNDSGFAVVSDTEFSTWKSNPAYAIDDIEDVLNLGINYIVKVGNDLDGDSNPETSSQITIRILPVVADTQVAPAHVGTTPTPLVEPVTPIDPVPAVTDDGGGCSAATSQRPVDPVLPLLAALGLVGWGLRRARRH